MKTISIITPCYNEAGNVEELYQRIDRVFGALPQYRLELIFIDNHSTDRTVAIIKEIAGKDKRVKLIVNARNFGQIRSPYHALLQAKGDAVIGMCSDLQDPPELIPEFLARWEAGFRIALAVKTGTKDSFPMAMIRRAFYRFLHRIADVQIIQNFTGFGLFDRSVIEILRGMDDPYPYFRGMLAEIGFEAARIPYEQPGRTRGITKNNFYTLYELAMLGITSHSKVPIRLATMGGFVLALFSLLVSLVYLVMKLVWWNRFGMGMAPVLIGVFFFSSVQLFFIGLLGEYIAAIHTQVLRRPLVVELERVNFDDPPPPGSK